MRGRGRGHGWRWRGTSRSAVRFLEPTLLLLLHRSTGHGYTLMEQLGEYGLADVDPSAVYRALRDMEEQGWVISIWETRQTQGPPRRVYRLSTTGNNVLRWWMEDMADTRSMIDRLMGAYAQHMEEGQGEHH
jgi:PadR family transcriptional regulator PadR